MENVYRVAASRPHVAPQPPPVACATVEEPEIDADAVSCVVQNVPEPKLPDPFVVMVLWLCFTVGGVALALVVVLP